MAKKVVGEDGKRYKVKKPFFKRVWVWIFIVIIVIIVAASLGSKSDKSADKSSDNKSSKSKGVDKATAEEKYDSILKDYTKKIKAATPKLVDEYNEEAQGNEDGIEGLAKLSNEKTVKLAKISNDGIAEMAKVHLTSGKGKYEDYEKWATKLTDVYMEEAKQITEAYMQSAQ